MLYDLSATEAPVQLQENLLSEVLSLGRIAGDQDQVAKD